MILPALLARYALTQVRMCATGGQCQTRPVPLSSPSPYRFPVGLDFDAILPEQVTRQGSVGPPVRLTVTLSTETGSVLRSSATLGPLTMNPGTGRTCHYKGYRISAQIRSDGTLTYLPIA